MLIRLRRYFIAGLLVWLPVGATILVFTLLLRLTNGLLLLLPPSWRPEELLGFSIPGLGAIIALIVLVITGMLGANLLGRRLVKFYESLLERIPFVRTVYGVVKHFAEVVFSDSTTSFKKVLLIEYPRENLYSLAFQTSEDPAEVHAVTGEPIVAVFLPTTPNPTSGFMLFVPTRSVVELDMSVEEALKMIISLGVVVPDWHPLHPDAKVAAPKLTP
ncbi:MAG: DUF502 domain-containing protein [Gammaproteobacteria bacterium]|nr:MAG: DUF502 domain-containing protein [Gammaproteobacteria bacterium]